MSIEELTFTRPKVDELMQVEKLLRYVRDITSSQVEARNVLLAATQNFPEHDSTFWNQSGAGEPDSASQTELVP